MILLRSRSGKELLRCIRAKSPRIQGAAVGSNNGSEAWVEAEYDGVVYDLRQA